MKLLRIGFTFDTYPELLVSKTLLWIGLTTNAVSSPLNKYTYSLRPYHHKPFPSYLFCTALAAASSVDADASTPLTPTACVVVLVVAITEDPSEEKTGRSWGAFLKLNTLRGRTAKLCNWLASCDHGR
ncbi:hypothetical protein TB2_021592 [Malus domestica]